MSGAVDLSALKQPPAGAPAATGDHTVTEADFETKVLRRSMQVPVVVVLYSQRSPGSIELVQLLERLLGEANDTWDLAAVEAENNMRIAQAFGVQGIPTVVAVAGGQPLADFQGGQPEEQVRQWLAAVVQAVEGKLEADPDGEAPEPAADPRFATAEALLEQGDFPGAESAYESILSQEPANAEAKAALRQVKFLGRAQQLPETAIATADADPGNVAAALDAADVEMFQQQPEAAFDRLIGLIKRTSGDERTTVRTRLVELFELFDQSEPFVVAARRKLATALY
ncbi:tetratricopeptide repeat protein [Nocardia speluncae]|uniref:Tetratricopeptide repeat protein n=1 Tax=Nocardia speluncae TaxID=419477 RepID=A0A846XG98_9NOCA|nr:tetratricopeptide repeat protein [Nocardia speluncae]NKY35148.1 tetratricopeptide repeat protein [Nocardia speluncae]